MRKDARKMWLKKMAAVGSVTREAVLEEVVFEETSGYVVVLGRVSQVEGSA